MTIEDLKSVQRTLAKNKGRCWKGYAPVRGKKAYSKGSCRKVRGNPVKTRGIDVFVFMKDKFAGTEAEDDIDKISRKNKGRDIGGGTDMRTGLREKQYYFRSQGDATRFIKMVKKLGVMKGYRASYASGDDRKSLRLNPALKKLKFAPFEPIKMLEKAGDADEAQKLFIYFENDSNLMMRRYPQFELNLDRKVKRGIFDRTKALKLFLYLANEIAKDYAKFFRNQSGFSAPVASVSTRKLLASLLLEKYEGDRYPINKNSARLQNNGVRKKTWKIGEYAVGGIIEAMVNSEGNMVGIRNAEYKTGATISKQLFRWPLDKSRLEMYLNDLTTSYYADKIIQWLMAGSWELRSNSARISDVALLKAYNLLKRYRRLKELLNRYDVNELMPSVTAIRNDPLTLNILTKIVRFTDSPYHARKLSVDNLQNEVDAYVDETEQLLEKDARDDARAYREVERRSA
jgi:hypothetical protein